MIMMSGLTIISSRRSMTFLAHILLAVLLCSSADQAMKAQAVDKHLWLYKYMQQSSPVDQPIYELDLSWLKTSLEELAWPSDEDKHNKLNWKKDDLEDDIYGFSWKDCSNKRSSSNSLIHLNSLTLAPTPLHFPGNISVSFNADVNGIVQKPLKVEVRVSKKVGPAYIHVKTLNIDNICDKLNTKTCPTQFPHCHCPFSKGVYDMPLTSFYVKISTEIPGGSYKITARLLQENDGSASTMGGAPELGCVFLQLDFN